MKILVTGATGYIGSALAKKLVEGGFTIHVLVRTMDKLKNIAHPQIIPFQGELSDKQSIRKAMEGCSQVYHLAAYVRVWARDTATFYDMNVAATRNLLDVAKELNVRRIVYTSSASVFGPSIRAIVDENKTRDIDFFNEYEGSKALAESQIKDYIIKDNLDIVIVSPTRVYGPFLIGKSASVTMLIEKFVYNKWRFILGDGTKIGNYIYIDDVVNAHIAAMEKGKTGHIYILGGPNHSYLDFFKILRVAAGVKRNLYRLPIWIMMTCAWIMMWRAKYFNIEPAVTPKWMAKARYDWEVSPAKMENELGIKGRSLEEGLRLTIEWLNNKKLLKMEKGIKKDVYPVQRQPLRS